MSAKCRVCHRPLRNPAHVAAGIGPDCAQKAARRQAANELAQRMAYPAAKLERIDRIMLRLVRWLDDQQYNLAQALRYGRLADQAKFEWRVWFALRWCQRWQAVRQRAQRLAARTA